MPLTTAETAFAYAMQHESAKQDHERRLLMIEQALVALAEERTKVGQPRAPEALTALWRACLARDRQGRI